MAFPSSEVHLLLTHLRIFQRLTVGVVDQLIVELKESVAQVKGKPLGKGNMVTLYGQ